MVFVLIVVLVAALGVGGFFAYQKFLAPAPPQPAAPAEQQAAVEQPPVVTPQAEQPPVSGQPAATSFEQPAPPRGPSPTSSPARAARPSVMTPPKAAAPAPVASTPPPAAPSVTPSAAPPPAAAAPAEHPKRVEILKPETPIPQEAPRPTAPPAKAVYSGPPAGVMLWSGQLEKNGSVTINGNTASFGRLTGELPGVPVMIEVDQREFALAEAPGPSNGWKRMTIRSRSKRHSVVTIKWSILK